MLLNFLYPFLRSPFTYLCFFLFLNMITLNFFYRRPDDIEYFLLYFHYGVRFVQIGGNFLILYFGTCIVVLSTQRYVVSCSPTMLVIIV